MLKSEQVVNKYVYGLFIVCIGLLLFFGLKEFFSAFLGSIIFYILFKTFMNYLVYKRGWKKSFAAILIIIISFFIVILPIGTLVIILINQIQDVLKSPKTLEGYLEKLAQQLDRLPFDITLDNTLSKLQSFVSSHAGDFFNSTMNILTSILIMYFILYFLLVNVNLLEKKIRYYLPFDNDKINVFGIELTQQTYSNAIGVPTVAIVQGIAALVIYLITDAPDAGLLATLTGFSSIIPLVGTAIIWLPLSIFQLANGEIWQGVTVAIYCTLVLGNLDNLVRMFISKKIGDVHPMTTVFGVIIGLKFFGLPGLVFGPLLISYFFLMIKMFHQEYNEKIIVEEEKYMDQQEESLLKILIDKLLAMSKIKKKTKSIED